MAMGAKITRRGAFLAPLLPLIAGADMNKAQAQRQAGPGNILVAYFSRTGNIRLIATQIATALEATLFQITPATPYPADYRAQVAQAESERLRGYEPQLQALVPNIASYQTVYLGFPIWGTTAPSPIRSFLARHNLSGKTLIPFITHGGYGPGNSLEVVARHAPQAKLAKEFIRQCDPERDILEDVTKWLQRP